MESQESELSSDMLHDISVTFITPWQRRVQGGLLSFEGGAIILKSWVKEETFWDGSMKHNEKHHFFTLDLVEI